MPQPTSKKPTGRLKKQPWQKGAYARQQQLAFNFRVPFLLLCKVWGITPEQMLNDFVDALAHTHHNSTGRCVARQHIRNYVLEMGYGQQQFAPQAIAQQLAQLQAAGQVYPTGNSSFLMQHVHWLHGYYNWWYGEWQAKAAGSKKSR